MFTGIIVDVGRIAAIERRGAGAWVRIETSLDLSGASVGDSIAVNGVCLTATALGRGSFEAELSPETVALTTFAKMSRSAAVNLEPALRVGDPLGGHLVQGHVDGVGSLVANTVVSGGAELTFALPGRLLGEVVLKGSIALDGISLTVARLDGDRATIAVIGHTLTNTNLGDLAVGAAVNIETDVLGKYVARQLKLAAGGGGLTLERLRELGWDA